MLALSDPSKTYTSRSFLFSVVHPNYFQKLLNIDQQIVQLIM